jgi:hypothetical protein
VIVRLLVGDDPQQTPIAEQAFFNAVASGGVYSGREAIELTSSSSRGLPGPEPCRPRVTHRILIGGSAHQTLKGSNLCELLDISSDPKGLPFASHF